MNDTSLGRIPPDQSSGSLHTYGTLRHPSVIDPILSKRVCFYKSGDPQFSGLRMVVNNRTFKTFEALLDSLSKKVPLPFGVRNITTPHGVHTINTLDELEDGKSYICSDSRKVKPINLAQARKKLPPWYHARPVSAHRHRKTVQRSRAFSGWTTRRQEPVLVHTPKRLVVFRNGDPSVKHPVVLRKRSMATFESILEYISELMQFHVVKLHTPDGRRVEGLPGLILCSGMVVAAGKEPFRPASYNSQKSLVSTRPSVRRLKALSRKKKSVSYKSRNFSTSSERYIVNKIHNSLMESSCDIPSNPTNSIESGHVLESVAETKADGETPSEDDIEKSFRVNQDGSMTVEMRVRLTVKEEETLHWTTTLSRLNVANQLNMTCLPEPESEQDICTSASMNLHNPASSNDTINKDKTKDNHNEELPSLGNGVFSQSSYEDDDIKKEPNLGSPRREQTPGHKLIRKKQASHLFREETEDAAMTEEYCMVMQSSTRPIPKPRRLSYMDANALNNTSFKSDEVMQIESSGEEITETVLHIYEQQTCQDNFHANVCTHGMAFYRPVTSETEHPSTNNFEPELCKPSTASESINIWKARDKSVPSPKRSRIKVKQQVPKSTKGKINRPQHKSNKTGRSPKVNNKGFRRLLSPGKKQNSSGSTEKRKKAKTFSSAGFLRRIYGNKLKSPKSKSKLKRRLTQSDDYTLKVPHNQTKHVLQMANNMHEARAVLIRQTSVHREKKENKRYEVSEQMPLPAFDSSSSIAKEYVESWLKKAQINRDGSQSKTEGGYAKTENEPPLPEDMRGTSVQHRIQSLENKMAASNLNVQNNIEETKPEPKINYAEMPPNRQMGNEAIQESSDTLSMELPLPPPPEEETPEKSKSEYPLTDGADAVACKPTNMQPSGTILDNHSPFVDPTPAQDLLHSQHVMKMSKLLQPDVPNTLQRASSVKRAPLISNMSLERNMSVRKACLDKFTVCNHDNLSENASKTLCKQQSLLDAKARSSVSPNSLSSDERLSSVSIVSSEAPTSPNNLPMEESSPKPIKSPPPNGKVRSKSFHHHPLDKKISPNMAVQKQVTPNTSPLPDKRQTLSKSKLSKQFTHSHSMDLVSPPARRKTKKKVLSRNLSSDSTTEVVSTVRKTPSQRKNTLKALTADQDKTCTTSLKQINANYETSEQLLMDKEFQAQPLKTVNLLDNVCYSIKSIRQITQNKRPSSSEKSNSLPDFFSQVASTFGSSSKVLLAFLSIMTLKDSIANLSVDQLRANDVSSAEALKMINSLREIASMEDSQQLRDSLSELQKSATKQLLDSWTGFQEMGEKYKSSPSGLERDLTHDAKEPVIDDFIDRLNIPEILKEELTSLPARSHNGSDRNENMTDEKSEAEDCRSEEHTEGSQRFDEQPKINLDQNISHSNTALEQWSDKETEHEDEPLGDGCYVELTPRRKGSISSPEKEKEVSLRESTVDVNEQTSSEVNHAGLKIIVDESQRGPKAEEDCVNKHTEEIQEDILVDKRLVGDSPLETDQHQDPDIMSLIDQSNDTPKNGSLGENDSGNDHSSCKDHVEELAVVYEQIKSSTEEELSFYEKELGSGEVHSDTKCNRADVPQDQSEEITSHPVAVRVSLLEKQVAERQRTRYKKEHAKKASLVLDVEKLATEISKHCSRSAPQSSLSFSYDSSNVVFTELEGNRVKFIRDMFLAKGSADVPKYEHGLNTTQPSEFSADSGGYQTQTSSERSSSEEDSSRKSISKGFVRRTIERLYGKKDTVERPPLAPRTKKKRSSIFSPLHMAQCKAASELSYFNSTTALDTLTEATRCIAFNAQVGPGDSVPIDTGRWLIRENTLIRKSVSDPTGINKNLVNCHESEDGCEDTQENTPYSLFSTTSDPEDSKKSKRCTYFSLPHTSDSEVCLDDPSALSKNEVGGNSDAKDSSEGSKAWSERNGSAVGDCKIMDNKVHPLVELPADGEVVVVSQPGKGHGVVNKRLQEPDVLDILYNFCGENCPIL
ncbi:oxygen-regulated protein 1-like [Entelurus aequoreus]|uniref:oxygen-regulated protein 1-like n=1 Tax=Entelurus aequoreus TaxID=161455 RepID=UPI002B1DE0C2|nr:oxygen-regulated protein 1-like [Entelurus aequoreus]